MSRFFHGGLSDSESSSDEEELYSGSEEESQEEESSAEESEAEEAGEEESSDEEGGGNKFLAGAQSDDSDDDEGKRTVKSAKDKRAEEIEGIIKLIENAKKINDWVVISAGEFIWRWGRWRLRVVKLAFPRHIVTSPDVLMRVHRADCDDFRV